jgi:hypothetical protein
MNRAVLAAVLGLAAACSSITETPGGVGSISMLTPYPPEVEVGQTIRLVAFALNGSGDTLSRSGDTTSATPIYFRALDTTIVVDSVLGLMTGRTGGTKGRVIARANDLYSKIDTFNVLIRADTVVQVAPDTQTVAAADTSSSELTVRLDGGTPSAPVSGRRVTYLLESPRFATADDRTVEFANSDTLITATTGSSGTPSPGVYLRKRAGNTAPDSAIVSVTAYRPGGKETILGSGQRFVIRFAKP